MLVVDVLKNQGLILKGKNYDDAFAHNFISRAYGTVVRLIMVEMHAGSLTTRSYFPI